MRTGNGLWRSALLREKCAPVDDVFGARTVFCHTRRSLTCSRLRPFKICHHERDQAVDIGELRQQELFHP